MSLSIAIVGSGPAGFYAVEGLCKQLPDCRIDMIDRLPTPFGLVRSGVAPDHQTTKNVVRVFDRLMEQADIRYLGNVELGRDLSMAELKETYDAVILAIGASGGRRLGLAGGDAVGVYTADTIVGWYNGHPDYENLDPVLPGPGVAVFGIGNVALDVARLAASTAAEFAPTDIAPYAADAIEAAPISEVHIIGRRGPVEAAFSKAELAEMGEMVDCVALVDGAQLPDEVVLEDAKQQRVKAANLKILQSYADNKAGDKPVSARFHFFASPVEFLTEDRDGAAHLVGVRLERTRLEDGRAVGTGETYDLAVSTAVLCIGYKVEPPEGVPLDEARGTVSNEEGRVEPGVYVVGWAKRGPSGTIALNRGDSHGVVEHLVADLGGGDDSGKPGRAGLDELLAARDVRVTGYDDWKRIDEAEQAAAVDGAPRAKLTSVAAMLELLED